jgi:hypothetical protein
VYRKRKRWIKWANRFLKISIECFLTISNVVEKAEEKKENNNK